MKLHLPLSLRSSLLACIAAFASAQAYTATNDLGDTMFVGDSITHGVNAKSWRWEIHKIFTDNGISYSEVGVQYGNYSGGSNLNLIYGNSTWLNYHASQSSERAWEISGRGKTNGRLDGTNIRQWLRLEDGGGKYQIAESAKPSTYFMMIGTNDLLSENGSTGRLGVKTATGEWQNLPTKVKFLLGTKDANGQWDNSGDMYAIIDAMRKKSGEGVDIVLLSVPTVYAAGRPNDFNANDLEALSEYNTLLADWAKQKGVTLVQSDKGIVDVAAPDAYKGQGVENMFNASDRLHPTAQGDLIIAGNVAKQLGYAGRTAGQKRMKAADFRIRDFASAKMNGTVSQSGSSVTLGSKASISYEWETSPTGGYTVDFTLSGGIGDGAKGGWNTTDNFSVSLGDGVHGGTLNINEAYIQWGNTILYSCDTSGGLSSLRVAYVYGNKARGLDSGFYVWLDDQLIGEGLADEKKTDGLSITNDTGAQITLADLVLDADGSWAPWTKGKSIDNPLIIPAGQSQFGDFPGRKEWCSNNALNPDATTISGNVRTSLVDTAKGFKGGSVASGSIGNAYINQGIYKGDLYVTLESGVSVSNYSGFHGVSGTYTGDGYLRFLGGSYQTWFGVVNVGDGNKFDGNLYFELSGDDVLINGAQYSPSNLDSSYGGTINVGIAGAFYFTGAGGLTGEFRLVVNAGTINNTIYMGTIKDGNNTTNVGSTSLYINGGIFTGNIFGGGTCGKVGASSITITGDEMVFSGTTVISAGGSGTNGSGDVTGTSTVTIADVTQAGGFGRYTGKLLGGRNTAGSTRALVFSGAVLQELKAQIEEFDSITLEGESSVGLNSFGGATSVTVNGGSTLTVLEDAEAKTLDNMGTVKVSSGKTLKVEGVAVNDLQALAGTYELEGSALSMGAATNGRYVVQVSGSSSLSLAKGAQGTYDVHLAEGSTLALSADGFAGQLNLRLSGSGTLTGVAGAAAAVSIDDSPAAGNGAFDLGGVDVTDLCLTHLSAGSQVSGIGGSGALTLTGESSIVLGDAMQKSEGAMLKTDRKLTMADGATLHIDVNGIISAVENADGNEVAYYLTTGDLSSLPEGALVFDATLSALKWNVTLGQDGALRFAQILDTAPGNVYVSSNQNSGSAWDASQGNIYESVGGYDAVLADADTLIDLRGAEVPQEYEQDGLTIHNLVGNNAQASLSIIGESAKASRVTLTNTLGSEQRKMLENMLGNGIKIVDSLTFAGNIELTDVQLQIKHVDPDMGGVGKADATTVVQGNLTVNGDGGLLMTSGVLRLEGAENNLGSGDVSFAGNDGQLVVAKGKALTLSGAVVAETGVLDTARTEHILMEKSARLVLAEGASVGAGVTLGNEDAAGIGCIAVMGSRVQVDAGSRLAHVDLQVQGAMDITPERTRQADAGAAWELAGLSGSGAISSAASKDMAFTVAGSDHTFSGNLENYHGTMSFAASSYTQYFSGVKGGSNWNVTNRDGGRVVFDLAGNGGSNALTLGKLTLERGSDTSILLDLTSATAPTGLLVNELEATTDATLTVGHHDGLATIKGKDGEAVTLAVISIAGDDHDFARVKDGVTLKLSGIRNAEEVFFSYSETDKVLSLVTLINEAATEYAAYATERNSLAGARMLWAVENSYLAGGDLAALDETVYTLLSAPQRRDKANLTKANRILAAAAGASLSVLGQAICDDVERQLHSIRNRSTTLSYVGDSKQAVDVWINAESNYNRLHAEGLMPGYKINSRGGTVGAAAAVGKNTGVGLTLTAMYGDLSSDGPDLLKGDMDTCYVSAFVSTTQKAWRHTLLATVGQARVDARRTVNYGGGSYSAGVDTDGTMFGLMYEVGYSIPMNEACSVLLQPIANVSFRHSRLNGFNETGSSNARLRVSAQEQSCVAFGVGARMQGELGSDAWNHSGLFELRALMKAYAGDSSGEASVAFSHERAIRQTVESASVGSFGIELGGGISLPLCTDCVFFADASVELRNGYTNANASVGINISY